MKKVFIAMLLVFALVGGTHATDLTELFVNGVPITGSSNSQIITGKVFYVGSSYNGVSGSDSGPSGASISSPYATAEYATNATTASRGDIVYFLPGHAENITSATTWAVDKAGVKYVGLGSGSLRPTFTWTTASTACVTVSAANVTFENFIFDGTGVDGVTKMFNLNAATTKFINCEFIQGKETSASTAVAAVTFEDTADNHVFDTCNFIAKQTYEYTNTTAAALSYSEATDSGTLRNNRFTGAYATAMISAAVTNTNLDITADNSFKGYSPGVPEQLHATTTVFNLSDLSPRTVVLYADPVAGATTKTIATVVGDGANILSIYGRVTTAIQAQNNATLFSLAPSDSTTLTNTLITSSLDITGDVVGSIYSVGDLAGALVNSGTLAVGNNFTDGQEFFVAPGVIGLNTADDNTGAVTWSIRWMPVSNKSYVY